MTPRCSPGPPGVSVRTTIPSVTGMVQAAHRLALPLHLHQAHPANAYRVQLGMVAEDGDVNPDVSSPPRPAACPWALGPADR